MASVSWYAFVHVAVEVLGEWGRFAEVSAGRLHVSCVWSKVGTSLYGHRAEYSRFNEIKVWN